MFKIESGVLDKTRLFSNFLMIVLLAGNLFFTAQYFENLKPVAPVVNNTGKDIQIAHFLQEFIVIVLNPQTPVSSDDRVKLENDVRQIGDPDILADWQAFVSSSNAKDAQASAIKLMSLLSAKMIQ